MSETRAKSTISYERLKDLMKEHMPEPADHWTYSDQLYIIKTFKPFLKQLGKETNRVNGVAIAMAAQHLFKYGKPKSQLFGKCLSTAFSAVKLSGDKSSSGLKLTEEVREVYNAMLYGQAQGSTKKSASSVPLKQEAVQVKTEPGKHPPKIPKVEPGPGPAQNASQLENSCLTSPSKILKLYHVQDSPEQPGKKIKVPWP